MGLHYRRDVNPGGRFLALKGACHYDNALVPSSAVEVGCAIIRAKRGAKRETELLIAQRKPGVFLGGYWEFPGGKIEDGESVQACLEREVFEELGVRVRCRELFSVQDHTYPEKTVRLHFYFCNWESGEASKKDCHDFRWIRPEGLKDFNFIPADTEMINELVREKKKYFG